MLATSRLFYIFSPMAALANRAAVTTTSSHLGCISRFTLRIVPILLATAASPGQKHIAGH
jgi:hypothetical protein